MLVDVKIGLYVLYQLDGGSRSFEAFFVLFGSLRVLVTLFLFDVDGRVKSEKRAVRIAVAFGRSWRGRRRGRGNSGGVSVGDASNGRGGRGRWSALPCLP